MYRIIVRGVHNPRIVKEYVQSAEFVLGRSHHLPAVGIFRHISFDKECPPALCLHLGHSLLAASNIDIHHNHCRAFLGKEPG